MQFDPDDPEQVLLRANIKYNMAYGVFEFLCEIARDLKGFSTQAEAVTYFDRILRTIDLRQNVNNPG